MKPQQKPGTGIEKRLSLIFRRLKKKAHAD